MITPLDVPRLLAARGPSLQAHLAVFGELPDRGTDLIAELEESGLSGRGGAAFPTWRKLAATNGRKPVVVGNGAEGEPLSRKDVHLLTRAPHLVLDGLQAAAAAIGADKVYLYLHDEAAEAVGTALDERRQADIDARRVELVSAPERFVAGEESAAIRKIEGGPALPRDRTVVSAISGVRGRPTLVNNVETLAHAALIARYGARWFRSVGEDSTPGTMLVTLSGACHHNRVLEGVLEVPTGALLTGLLEHAGGVDLSRVAAVLMGGYHGSWIPVEALAGLRLSRQGLEPLGAGPGAGIVHVLGVDECGLARTAEIARYLAEQSAQQCGPCLNGLPRLAELFDELAYSRPSITVAREIRRIADLVDGRGSCRHPDGTARMLRSALTAFAADIELRRRKRCYAADVAAMDPEAAGEQRH